MARELVPPAPTGRPGDRDGLATAARDRHGLRAGPTSFIPARRREATISRQTRTEDRRRLRVNADYIYNGEDQVCEERAPGSSGSGTSGGGVLRQFIWGQYVDELIQQREYQPGDAGLYHDLYPLADLHYRTAALTHESQAVIEAYDTDAYGNTLIYCCSGPDGVWFTDDDELAPPPEGGVSGASGVPLCPYIYLGYRYDPESGLYVAGNGVRYYDPALGRFTQFDPSGYVDGMNLYEFLRSNPNAYVDPSGGSSQPGSSWYQELWWAYKHGFTNPMQNLSLQSTNLGAAYPRAAEAVKLALEFPQNRSTIASYMLSDPLGGAAQLFEAGLDTVVSMGTNTLNAGENLVRLAWDIAAFGHNMSLAGQVFTLPYAGRRYWAQDYGVGARWYPATLSVDLIEFGLPAPSATRASRMASKPGSSVRNARAWYLRKLRGGLNKRQHPQGHHSLIAHGGGGKQGRLTKISQFFDNSYGRFISAKIKDSSLNLIQPTSRNMFGMRRFKTK